MKLVGIDKKNTLTSNTSLVSTLITGSFFLGGISVGDDNTSFYVPIVAILSLVLIPFYFSRFKFSLKYTRPYIFFSISILISSFYILFFLQGQARQVVGIFFIFFGWLSLFIARKKPILNGKSLTIGFAILYTQIVFAFLSALRSQGSNAISYLQTELLSNTYNFYSVKQEIVSLFGNSNYLAAFMLFFVGFFTFRKNYFLTFLSLIAIIMSLSRTALIISVVFIIFSLLFGFSRRILTAKKRSKKALSTIILIAFLSIIYLLPRIIDSNLMLNASQSNLLDTRTDGFVTLTGRTYVWMSGINLALENPIFGVGYGKSLLFHDLWSFHNGIIDYWVSYGFFAVLSFIVFISHIIRLLAKVYQSTSLPINLRLNAQSIIPGILLMLVHGMVEPLYLDSKFLIFLCLILGSTISVLSNRLQHISTSSYV